MNNLPDAHPHAPLFNFLSRNDGLTVAIRAAVDERIAQNEQWGGAAHDDEHTVNTTAQCWRGFILDQYQKARADLGGLFTVHDELRAERARLVKMAALAIAGIESIDRVLVTDDY
jgi:hypothetical protein